MEINWSELVIFAIVIIANIIGGIVKINQKKRQKQLAEQYNAPQAESDDYFEEETFYDTQQVSKKTVLDTNFTAPAAPAPESTPKITAQNSVFADIQVEEIEDEDDDTFDYGSFMRKHGREAFILAEIVLPPNSRQK